MNYSVSHKAVYRTAPATSDLLNIYKEDDFDTNDACDIDDDFSEENYCNIEDDSADEEHCNIDDDKNNENDKRLRMRTSP